VACRKPFSRHRDRGESDPRTPDERLLAAYEYLAHAYGWAPEEVEEQLTDEQLVAYLDAATDRLVRDGQTAFENRVEAARMGTIFASDQRAYTRWRARVDRKAGRPRGLTGGALESAVSALALSHPEYVVVGG